MSSPLPHRTPRQSRQPRLHLLSVLLLALTCLTALPSLASAKKSKNAPPQPFVRHGTIERTVPIRTHSIYAPYVDSDLQNRWFDFGGSTIINTNKHIRLTQDRPSQSGWLWSRLPLHPTSFEIEIEFRVDGRGNTISGDGLAIWLTKQRASQGPAFGFQDYWDGLGIFIDTYANARHSWSFPYIMGMLNDGSKKYDVHKDGQGQELKGEAGEKGSCSLDVRRTDITAKAKITYFKNNFLELQIQHEKWDEWTTCFSIANVTLPAQPFLGFTSHTGDVSDEHDIISISTTNVVYHPPNPFAQNRPPPRRSIVGSGFFSALGRLLKWAALLVVLVVIAIAGRSWKASRDSKRF